MRMIKDGNVVGRKAHRCGLCDENIAKGENHYRQVVADGADMWTWRAHDRCDRLRSEFQTWCGGDDNPYFWEDWTPMGGEFGEFLRERTVRGLEVPL